MLPGISLPNIPTHAEIMRKKAPSSSESPLSFANGGMYTAGKAVPGPPHIKNNAKTQKIFNRKISGNLKHNGGLEGNGRAEFKLVAIADRSCVDSVNICFIVDVPEFNSGR